jgi:NADPH-dependent 2,4-dienoyl-CoA reductase/sulfur reductase-like enzyme/peroxiredoxin family protein/TusA-related sulfurtransferase/rhodanese-related sulfurtransferase
MPETGGIMAKTVIIGGVAGGATAAARLRRLDEKMEIVVLERGDYISYANCGLPYYIGDVIKEREALLLQTPERMKERYNIDVRVKNEVTSIDRKAKTVTVRKEDGTVYEEAYDALIIATGSSPLKPPIPGIDTEGIYTLWTVNDTDRIRAVVDEKKPERAAVIGGGFIGLEMAENLHARGIQTAIIEAQDQVMAPIDYEMAQILHKNIRANGVSLYLGDGVKSFEKKEDAVTIRLAGGGEVEADLVILSIGVRPNSALAREAGLACNARGGIIVDDSMQTEDQDIWAVGDDTQIERFGTGEKGMIPLAGPANKQGRIAAGNIAARYNPELADQAGTYKGTQGTSVAQVFDNEAAATGTNEKTLIREGKVKGKDYLTQVIVQKSHAGYYPGATDLYIKLIYTPGGTILGAQAVGPEGADKRIDTISVAARLGAGATDLTDLEMAYAPPYSSAKDPVNMSGYVAENVLKGIMKLRTPAETKALMEEGKLQVLDIREDLEVSMWHLEGSVHIPMGQLRSRIGELSGLKESGKEIAVLCGGGVRAWNSARVLSANGFENVSVIEGGAGFYRIVTEEQSNPEWKKPEKKEAAKTEQDGGADLIRVDCCGMQCPGPIMKVSSLLKDMKEGETLQVSATDMGFASDVESWCSRTGNTFISSDKKGTTYVVTLKKGTEESREGDREKEESGCKGAPAMTDIPHGKTMVIFDGDFDKALASFIIANGAAAMGRPVTMFFTFWGLNILRKHNKVKVKKTAVEKMFGAMMPRGTAKLALSKMNMLGMGTRMMKMIMKKKNVLTLDELIKSAMENGVRIVACTMSMDVMGIKKEELIDGIEYAGVASYLGDAEMADVNLFI